jgi:hypothetical protein
MQRRVHYEADQAYTFKFILIGKRLMLTFRNFSQLFATFRNFSQLFVTFRGFSQYAGNSCRTPHTVPVAKLNMQQISRTVLEAFANPSFGVLVA